MYWHAPRPRHVCTFWKCMFLNMYSRLRHVPRPRHACKLQKPICLKMYLRPRHVPRPRHAYKFQKVCVFEHVFAPVACIYKVITHNHTTIHNYSKIQQNIGKIHKIPPKYHKNTKCYQNTPNTTNLIGGTIKHTLNLCWWHQTYPFYPYTTIFIHHHPTAL